MAFYDCVRTLMYALYVKLGHNGIMCKIQTIAKQDTVHFG